MYTQYDQCTLFYKPCCTCMLERAVEILSLSIVNAVIKAKIVRRSSMLLSTECCHWSEEGRILARERKDDGVDEKAHHWVFSRRCFAGACQAHKYNNLVFQALALLWNELPTACMCVTIIDSVFYVHPYSLELSPPGRHYLWLSKAHKNLMLPGGELHIVPFNSLWSSIILQTRLIIDKLGLIEWTDYRVPATHCHPLYLVQWYVYICTVR